HGGCDVERDAFVFVQKAGASARAGNSDGGCGWSGGRGDGHDAGGSFDEFKETRALESGGSGGGIARRVVAVIAGIRRIDLRVLHLDDKQKIAGGDLSRRAGRRSDYGDGCGARG